MSRLVVLDSGNARIKTLVPAKTADSDLMFDDLHAIAPLTQNEWLRAIARGIPQGYIRVNGEPYAVGDSARRHSIADRPRGAQRYRKGYYDVILANSLSKAFSKSQSDITLFASHAPKDFQYADNLRRSALGTYEVESSNGTLIFDVKRVETYDEPVGGYSEYTLNRDGGEKQLRKKAKNDLAFVEKTILISDSGGHTTDTFISDPYGKIDVQSLRSINTGSLMVIDAFISLLMSRYKDKFQDTARDLDINRVMSAIRTGMYRFGKEKLDCVYEATQAKNLLANDVYDIIQSMGGASNFDAVLLTGGGSMLVYDTLVANMPQMEFILATEDTEKMMFANVMGGAKLFKMLSSYGVLS